jgi:hypothetical protein
MIYSNLKIAYVMRVKTKPKIDIDKPINVTLDIIVSSVLVRGLMIELLDFCDEVNKSA